MAGSHTLTPTQGHSSGRGPGHSGGHSHVFLGPGHARAERRTWAVIWTGRYYSISAEVLWPLNGASGHNIGVVGQFHLYFDDLFPNTLGKPISEWFQ